MATSTGKIIGFILIVSFIFVIAWQFTPLVFGPLGFFSGPLTILRTPGLQGIRHIPNVFRWTALSGFSLAMLVIWIAVVVWVYRDSERRNMNGVLWALLVLIGNLIGLLIYLIVRSDNLPSQRAFQAHQTCADCQKTIPVTCTFCPHCGIKLQPECPACKESIEKEWKACPHCGEKLPKS